MIIIKLMVVVDFLSTMLVGPFVEVSVFSLFAVAYVVGAYHLLQGSLSPTLKRRNLSLLIANTCMLGLSTAVSV